MTPETAARAFEPFFTTKPKGKGTGLGLATVHGVVNQLGGYVGIYSEPGHGTTVRAYIPATETPAEQPFVQTPSPRIGRGEAVLVIEDDEDMRALTVRILTQNGYSVVSADRGATAVTMLEDPANFFDLILTDVVMPEMSGREVAKQAATLRPELPVLFMSGYAEDLVTDDNTKSKRFDVVEKPFTQAALLGSVAAAIGRKPVPAGR
jgi:two-component system, cell cycle sensor histidine kinase and response regulator CckA